MEAAAAAPPAAVRCRACNQDAGADDVITNGFNVPFHRSCFPVNHLKQGDPAPPRQPLSTINSAEKLRLGGGSPHKEKRTSRRSIFSDDDRAALASLHRFANEDGNNVCADCAAPQPRWVSVNLGVFLCPQCSGEHRALGSHITRVRSLGLDHWTADGIKTILEWGNVRANAVLEAHIPEGFSKPGPRASPAEKRCWVRAKYLHKAFSEGGRFTPDMLRVPPPSTAGPCYIGVLRVTVVCAAYRKKMKTSCVLRLGKQSVTTKRAPASTMPAWGETHMLSIPNAEATLEVTVRRKTRFGSRAVGTAHVNLAELPLRELEGEDRHEVVVPIKTGAAVTLQLALLCTD